nr:hypothetical protein [Tanacetum cinerariifolium]
MESVKKSIEEREAHKRDRTESEKQDTNTRSGNVTDVDDAYIKPVYDEEPMAKVQLNAECNAFDQQHDEQPEFNNEGGIDQDCE